MLKVQQQMGKDYKRVKNKSVIYLYDANKSNVYSKTYLYFFNPTANYSMSSTPQHSVSHEDKIYKRFLNESPSFLF